MKTNNHRGKLIHDLELNEIENVVDNWYSIDMPILFQSEDGLDLEEIIQDDTYEMHDVNIIEEKNLTKIQVLECVIYWYENIYPILYGEPILNEDDVELNEFCYEELEQFKKFAPQK